MEKKRNPRRKRKVNKTMAVIAAKDAAGGQKTDDSNRTDRIGQVQDNDKNTGGAGLCTV
ncbi:hypothetical protein IMSAGC019_03620 [Lachnospiraceae bacterium]|nr:hypothetical protein IMSAGC019_03620 [Lachnospiraceae bacterium]